MAIDQNWVLFKQGNNIAFEKIYKEHINELYDYGKRFSLDTNVVEDCIQNLFIDIWNNRKNLGDVENVKAYLFISLKRRIVRFNKKSLSVVSIDESIYFKSELSIETILVDTEMNSEKIKKLHNAYQKLSKKQQHILYLKFFQGFNNKEIAEILEINYQSARNALNRALSKLKTYFTIWMVLANINFLLKFPQ